MWITVYNLVFCVTSAPKFFTVIFNLMKPFMHQATLDKMRIFGSDKEEWAAALLEDIEADNLPLHYGGTMVDPDGDPKCPSKVRKLFLVFTNKWLFHILVNRPYS
jgi:CRAL/TRIO domain